MKAQRRDRKSKGGWSFRAAQILEMRQHLEVVRRDWNQRLIDYPKESSGLLCTNCSLSFLDAVEGDRAYALEKVGRVCGPCAVENGIEDPAPWWWVTSDPYREV